MHSDRAPPRRAWQWNRQQRRVEDQPMLRGGDGPRQQLREGAAAGAAAIGGPATSLAAASGEGGLVQPEHGWLVRHGRRAVVKEPQRLPVPDRVLDVEGLRNAVCKGADPPAGVGRELPAGDVAFGDAVVEANHARDGLAQSLAEILRRTRRAGKGLAPDSVGGHALGAQGPVRGMKAHEHRHLAHEADRQISHCERGQISNLCEGSILNSTTHAGPDIAIACVLERGGQPCGCAQIGADFTIGDSITAVQRHRGVLSSHRKHGPGGQCRGPWHGLPDDDVSIEEALLLDGVLHVPLHDIFLRILVAIFLPTHQGAFTQRTIAVCIRRKRRHLVPVHERLQALLEPAVRRDHALQRLLVVAVATPQRHKPLHGRAEILDDQQADVVAPPEDLVGQICGVRQRPPLERLRVVAPGDDAQHDEVRRVAAAVVRGALGRQVCTEGLVRRQELEACLAGLAYVEQEQRHVRVGHVD
mmetsp:Transcript_33363/g.92088  ORF Transcript_33363/g.92088 Transcript_33363/m.92088 type:complete len:472 (-) Transcript_33363:2648-4063(-)